MTNEDRELLELFKPLRVCDVRDGMDYMGYHHYGSMNPSIKPLFRTKAFGIAKTARYVPYEGPAPLVRAEDYKAWSSWYYQEVCTYPWAKEDLDGYFMAIDVGGTDVGLMGSENALGAMINGCRGFVLSGGGIRDTDECIAEKIPAWQAFTSQGMDQARIRYADKDVPVAIGGVAIYPGDIIVADGDGVIVVPRQVAKEVAKYGANELYSDKIARRAKYEELGWELDDSVINS